MTTNLTLGAYSPSTYRRASAASYLLGIAGLLVFAIAFDLTLIGHAVFIAGIAGGMTVPTLSERPVSDERDAAITREASAITMAVIGYGGLVVLVSLWVLEALGAFAWATWQLAVFFAWSATMLFWGAVNTYVAVRA